MLDKDQKSVQQHGTGLDEIETDAGIDVIPVVFKASEAIPCVPL